MLFSATMPKPIMEITKKFQNNAKVIKVTKKELTVPNIEQYYYDVKPKKKRKFFPDFLIFIHQGFRLYSVIRRSR